MPIVNVNNEPVELMLPQNQYSENEIIAHPAGASAEGVFSL